MKCFPVKVRLTVWYGFSMAVILMAFCVAVDLAARKSLLDRLDAALREELREICVEIEISKTRAQFLEAAQSRFYRHDAYDFVVQDAQGAIVFSSAGVPDGSARQFPAASQSDIAVTYRVQTPVADVTETTPEFRVINANVQSGFGPLQVVALTSMAITSGEMAEIRSVLFWLYPASLIPAVLGGYLLASRAMSPIRELSEAARRFSINSLDARVPVTNPRDEIGILAGTLNGLMERLETAVREIQRFTGDASHELRTPIAALQAEAELALSRSRSPAEYIAALTVVVQEARRLGHLSDQLLVLSRNDAGCFLNGCDKSEPASLALLIQEVVEEFQPAAFRKDISVTLTCREFDAVTSQPVRVRQVVVNLLENAIKYSFSGSHVGVSLIAEADCVKMTVTDQGCGISDHDLPKVLERFYRADTGRSTEGSGLGLSIVKSHVDSMGGRIDIQSKLMEGTCVTITLPLSSSICDSQRMDAKHTMLIA